jgi:signal transduction histidine kinase
MWIEGDYMCFYDDQGRITGHFGVQRDVTERTMAAVELEQSRQELRALAAKIQTAREEERTRIAREIHDELGQALTALKLDLSWAETKLPRSNSGVFRLGDISIAARIDKTMEIVRRIATELRPSILDQLGLEAAIEWLVNQSVKRSGLAVTLNAQELPALPDYVASHAFRIIQEALTNVTRHANASTIEVTVRPEGQSIFIEVRDNGVGIMPKSLSGIQSLGLVGMRERAVACGGTLKIRGEPGRGTAIIVEIPVAGV